MIAVNSIFCLDIRPLSFNLINFNAVPEILDDDKINNMAQLDKFKAS